MKVREDNFMGKQGYPFKGGGAVSVRAANEFVLAIGQLYQSGLAELVDEVATESLRNEVFQFHTGTG